MSAAEPPENSVEVKSRAAWRRWLARHHGRTEGVWLVTWRKHVPRRHVPYEAQVEEALCYGWVDSKGRALDADRTMLWFAPRKPRSGWSKPNKERVERLIAEGLMSQVGMSKVVAAKADGSWTTLDAVESLTVPRDLAGALKAHPPAKTHFAEFPRSVRRAILEWISNAKKPETRAKRIEETAKLAARNVRANQWRQPVK